MEQQAPSHDEKGRRSHSRRIGDGHHTNDEKNGGHEPIKQSHLDHLGDGSEVGILIDGANDEQCSQNKHQGRDECVGQQSQHSSQDDATHGHERGELKCVRSATGRHFCLVGNLLRSCRCGVIAHQSDDAGKKKQHADGDDNPAHNLFAIFNEQHANGYGTTGAENKIA